MDMDELRLSALRLALQYHEQNGGLTTSSFPDGPKALTATAACFMEFLDPDFSAEGRPAPAPPASEEVRA